MSAYPPSRCGKFLPIVIDVETSGLDTKKHGILEIAALTVIESNGAWQTDAVFNTHVVPFEGAVYCEKSMKIHGVDPEHPFRFAQPEATVMLHFWQWIKDNLKKHRCKRAVFVAHNAWFDQQFIVAAYERSSLKGQFPPFHSFSAIDTATLGLFLYGDNVLARLMQHAGIAFDAQQAHGALYDAQKTAELFCTMLTRCPPLTSALGDIDESKT